MASKLPTSPPPGKAHLGRRPTKVVPTPLGRNTSPALSKNGSSTTAAAASRRTTRTLLFFAAFATTTAVATSTAAVTAARVSTPLSEGLLPQSQSQSKSKSESKKSNSSSGTNANTSLPYPALSLVETVLLTTAQESFGGHSEAFNSAAKWTGERLEQTSHQAGRESQSSDDGEGYDHYYPRGGAHLACAEYAHGREAISRLRAFLSPEAVRPVAHSSEHGASCCIVTALPSQAREIAVNSDEFGVASIVPFPSDLKIAPGILEHNNNDDITPHHHHHDPDSDSGSDSGSGDDHRRNYQAAAARQEDSLADDPAAADPAAAAADPGSTTTTATPPPRLGVSHGASMRSSNAQGFTVVLSPGTLPAHVPGAIEYIGELLGDLMSESIDLRAGSVWSDPGAASGEHLSTRAGAARGRDWTLAAALVHGVSKAGRTSPGGACSWDRVSMHHAGDDLLLVSGLNHLLYQKNRGEEPQDDKNEEEEEEEEEEEITELRVACFMGLVSFLAGRAEVLRVEPRHKRGLYNAVARSMIQSATLTEEPLTDAGLDGTGQVIQVVDTGLDETSCYFIDADGEEVPHGHYFEELGVEPESSSTSSPPTYPTTTGTTSTWPYTTTYFYTTSSRWTFGNGDDEIDVDGSGDGGGGGGVGVGGGVGGGGGGGGRGDEGGEVPTSWGATGAAAAAAGSTSSESESLTISGYAVEGFFEGGDFSFFPERRKIIQYINLIKTDSIAGSHGSSFTNHLGEKVPWFPAEGFEIDDVVGHGTHTAGSAAGATLNTPAEPVTCSGTKTMGCVGGCIEPDGFRSTDDVVEWYSQSGYIEDLDRICPMHECDDVAEDWCLSDDVAETLTEHGGMARGAKLAIFDGFSGEDSLVQYPGNGLWESCLDADCKIHSNSWGVDSECAVTSMDILYDDFMYKNQENLLIFAAGNDGELLDDFRTVCTMSSPAIGKNALAVGASSSGETRLTTTATDGKAATGTNGWADVDTVAVFSSYGPTQDGRIKPEVVAPGDAIYSAGGDGSESHSCRLWAYAGTSMSCPIVAGAAAMVRQYFVDDQFYVADVTGRGWCEDNPSLCEAFSPSSATVKALLINSANLMGGRAEPDGYRGFGRIHLAMGMPLGGEETLALFVGDSANYKLSDGETHEFAFEVDAAAGLDFRATLSWIDPANSIVASVQLLNNLDLVVLSPSGTSHTMWGLGEVDVVNNNERVIVDAGDVESGTYTVQVAADGLTTDAQRYSLVVNGAITPLAASSEAPPPPSPSTSSSSSSTPPSAPTSLSPPGSPSTSSSSNLAPPGSSSTAPSPGPGPGPGPPPGSIGTISPFGAGTTISPFGSGSGSDADTARSSSGAVMTQAAPGSLLVSVCGAAVMVSAITAVACTTV